MQTLDTTKPKTQHASFPWNIVMQSITISTFALNDIVRKKIKDAGGLIAEEMERVATIHFPVLNVRNDKGTGTGIITAHKMFREHHVMFWSIMIGDEELKTDKAMAYVVKTPMAEGSHHETTFIVNMQTTKTAVFVTEYVLDASVITTSVQPTNPRPARNKDHKFRRAPGKNGGTCKYPGCYKSRGEH